MIFSQGIISVNKQITIGFSFSLYLEDFFKAEAEYGQWVFRAKTKRQKELEGCRATPVEKIINSFNTTTI
jgi:hypothetical protein